MSFKSQEQKKTQILWKLKIREEKRWLIYNRGKGDGWLSASERVTTTLDAWWQQQGNNDNDDDCNGADNAPRPRDPGTRLKVESRPKMECARQVGGKF